MYDSKTFPQSARTAVEVLAELIDDLADPQISTDAREVLRVAAETTAPLGSPNWSIVALCRSKSLADRATACATLFARAGRVDPSDTLSNLRFNCCEGLLWAIVARINMQRITDMMSHPTARL